MVQVIPYPLSLIPYPFLFHLFNSSLISLFPSFPFPSIHIYLHLFIPYPFLPFLFHLSFPSSLFLFIYISTFSYSSLIPFFPSLLTPLHPVSLPFPSSPSSIHSLPTPPSSIPFPTSFPTSFVYSLPSFIPSNNEKTYKKNKGAKQMKSS